MLSQVIFSVEERRASLVVRDHNDEVTEEEIWTLPTTVNEENAADAAHCVFHDVYDYINFLVHGNG